MTNSIECLGDVPRKLSRLHGATVAVVDPEHVRSLTFDDLDRRRRRIANMLLALGLAPGARVAMVLRNCYVAAELVFGVATAGMILVTVNDRLTSLEVAKIFEDSGTSAVVTTTDHLALVKEAASAAGLTPRTICVGTSDTEALGYEAALEAASEDEPGVSVSPDDVAMLIYTSGTTGRPKGVMLTHQNLLASTCNYLMESFLPGTGVYVACVPYFHVACVVHLSALLRGMTVVVTTFNPSRILQIISERRVTHIALVPTAIAMLLDAPEWAQCDCSSLRRVMYAASPMPEGLLRRAITSFGPILEQFYGLTETTGLVTILTPPDHVIDGSTQATSRLSSCGREITNVWVEIVDDEGVPVPPGVRGEILVRGPNVMAGYWQNEDATKAALVDGWFHTGDVGERDSAGYVTIVDRVKDVIITGGTNVYPSEVEAVLQEVDGVADVAVIGVPDPVWGETVAAVVVARETSVTEDSLLAACSGRLAEFKRPRRFRFVELLPRNTMGKVDKLTLRARWDDL